MVCGGEPGHFNRVVEALWVAGCCALVIVGFFAANPRYVSETPTNDAADQYYNLLVRGLEQGRVDLPVAVPPGLAALADPLDPGANAGFRRPRFAAHRLHDLSYFEGRLYLYFGITPALVAFWPYHLITGGFLSQQSAVRAFCSLGFLAAVWTLHQIRRRCFPRTPAVLVAIGIIGFAAGAAVAPWLRRPEVYEVAASCAFAFAMLAFGFLCRALTRPDAVAANTTLASVALGLAVGARPSILPLVPLLLLPVFRPLAPTAPGWRARAGLVVRAVVPILCIGLALAAYNQLRFHDPFEFGQRYQLAGDRQDGAHFSARFVPFHLWMYFAAPIDWASPLIRVLVPRSMPPGHGDVEIPYGILSNTPFILLGSLAFLRARGEADARRKLRWFCGACLVAFALAAGVMLSFYGCCGRYEFEFASFGAMLAVVGSWAVVDPAVLGRRGATAIAVVIGAAAIYSAVVAWMMSGTPAPEEEYRLGLTCREAGDTAGAVAHFEAAIRLYPDYGDAHLNLGLTYLQRQDRERAIRELALASQDPEVAGSAAGSVAVLLHVSGRTEDALPWFERAMRHDAASSTYLDAGRAYLELHRVADAERVFAEGEHTAKAEGWRHFFRSCVLAIRGRPEAARAEYGVARSLQPSLPQVAF